MIVAFILVYTFWGHYIPGRYGHPYLSPGFILENIYLSPNGVWGFLTGLSATYIALFVIFGAFLLKSGGANTFTDLSLLLGGRSKGGPAKVAVIASGFFAMISGSSAANA